jgi:general secretion pathway protein J
LRTGRGFTLVELLVAVALLALIGAIGYRGLGSLLEAEARVASETRRWGDLAAVMAQIGQDLSLALERPEGGPAGELVIMRRGDEDGVASHSGPRRVGYRVREGRLEYLAWPSPGEAAIAMPAVSTLLDDVNALELRALAADGSWSLLQASTGQRPVLPRAVEAQLALASGARVTRLFVLP